MKKKQIVTIILLLVVVAGLSAGYVIYKDYSDKKKQEEEQAKEDESAGISIFDTNIDEIEEIEYTYNNNTISIIRSDDGWKQKDTEIPMNEEKMSEMLEVLASVRAVKEITDDMGKLEEFGLDKPDVSYSITMKYGSSHNIKLGLPVATEDDAYYAVADDIQKIYALTSVYRGPFTKSIVDMTELVDAPDIAMDNITGVWVNSKEGLDLGVEHMGDRAPAGYYSWEITKPYKDVLADTDRWKAKLDIYSSIEFKNCVAYNTDDYAKFGLDEPVASVKIKYYTVKESDGNTDGNAEGNLADMNSGLLAGDNGDDNSSEEDNDSGSGNINAVATPVPEAMREYHEYGLEISAPVTVGTGDEAEELCYVRPEGIANIYSMDADSAAKLYDYTAFDVADGCVYAKLIEDVRSYDVEYGSTKITVERKEEKRDEASKASSDSKKDTMNVYYVNGKKVEEKKALDLYSFAYLLEFSGEADPDKKDDSDVPALTISYHLTDGTDTVVKFLPYDGDNFYHVDRNGMRYFLTDKRGIDTLVKNYEEFMKEL